MSPEPVKATPDSPSAERVNRVGEPEPSAGADQSARSYYVRSRARVATVSTTVRPSGESESLHPRERDIAFEGGERQKLKLN